VLAALLPGLSVCVYPRPKNRAMSSLAFADADRRELIQSSLDRQRLDALAWRIAQIM